MKNWIIRILTASILIICTACAQQENHPNIVATTMPVYTFTQALCDKTPIHVTQLVQENVSCLHDYTLTVRHMKLLESADLLVVSGGGLESFLDDMLLKQKTVIDAAEQIKFHHAEDLHTHEHDHHHEVDPHYWLSIESAKQMALTICQGLINAYPEHSDTFNQNMAKLNAVFADLENYAQEQLSHLKHREIITFHDGFSYMAEAFDLVILKAIEEESGSEASAQELVEICQLVSSRRIPAIFIEKNGSSGAASVISRETGANVYTLDMAISGSNYFDAMYYNIDTLKEALE